MFHDKSIAFRPPYKRTRTSGQTTVVSLGYRGNNSNGTAPYSGTVADVALVGTAKSMTDWVTPGFRSLIGRGHRVNNPADAQVRIHEPYLAEWYRATFSDGGWYEHFGPTLAYVFGRLDVNAPQMLNTTNANALATVNTWARIEPAKSQSLVTLAEANKSWDLIYSSAKKVVEFWHACNKAGRTGNPRDLDKFLGARYQRQMPKRYLRWDDDGNPLPAPKGGWSYSKSAPVFAPSKDIRDQAARHWLEYRFGWTPLVHDIIDTLKAIYAADLRDELTQREIIRTGDTQKATLVTTSSLDAYYGGKRHIGTRRYEQSYEVRCYAHYRWKAPEGVLRRLNDFGLFDVPKALWELVPFSFLADRIIPVGDWLAALTPKIGVEVVDSGFAYDWSCVGMQELTGYPTGSPPNTSGGVTYSPAAPIGSKDRWEARSWSRVTPLEIPVFPPIDVKIGVKQMADVAALFRGGRKSHSRV